MSIRYWLRWAFERRRATRFKPEDLVCSYWTGGIAKPRPVRDIGLYGARIVSTDVFYLGTDVQIVLEDRAAEPDGAGARPHICIWSRVLHRNADAFGVGFLFSDVRERRRVRLFLSGVRQRVNRPEEQDRAEGAQAG